MITFFLLAGNVLFILLIIILWIEKRQEMEIADKAAHRYNRARAALDRVGHISIMLRTKRIDSNGASKLLQDISSQSYYSEEDGDQLD